jgi:glycosyltransferase involved in cell wall biosynthesis
MTPRVSVVMANYNYARFLPAAVESVLAQTERDFELVIVDDGSTDNSLAVIDRYLADPRVRCVRTTHLGQARAKSAAVTASVAPLVAFTDADDVWHPAKLERQLPLFADERVGVVHCRRTLIGEAGGPLPYTQPPLPRGDVLTAMFRNNFVCFSSAVARRIVLEHVGLFDPHVDLAVDYDLWLRAAKHYHFDHVDEPLVQYRIGHGNLSKRVGERLRVALLLMNRFLGDRGGDRQIDRGAMKQSLAETYCHMGIALRPYAPLQSSRWFLRALRELPRHRPAWRGLIGACMPAGLRRAAQSVMGSGDWERAYRSPENDPQNV